MSDGWSSSDSDDDSRATPSSGGSTRSVQERFGEGLVRRPPLKGRKRKAKPNSKMFPAFNKPQSPALQAVHQDGEWARFKSSSTSSLYISSTLQTPHNQETLRAMSWALFYHVDRGMKNPEPVLIDVFSEEVFPITKRPPSFHVVPPIDTIFDFVSVIFETERLAPECAILCLAYIERLLAITGLALHATNWRRVTLGSLIIASKVWEDQAVWNVDFLSVFPRMSVADLGALEKAYLDMMEYNVSLKASLYAKYYFELRQLSDVGDEEFSLKPLDTKRAQMLEERSTEREIKARRSTRSQSAGSDQLEKSIGRRVLS